MKAITLRNIPKEVARTIRRKAGASGSSINRAVIGLLEECVGVRGKKKARRAYHDLDELAGAWSRHEALRFQKALAGLRAIDRDVWR